MTSCSRIEAWFRGELSPAKARAVREHLATCAACTRELEWLRLEQRAFLARPELVLPDFSSVRRAPVTSHVASVSLLLAAASVAFLVGRPAPLPLAPERTAANVIAPYCAEPSEAICIDEPRMSRAESPRVEGTPWSAMIDAPRACSVSASVCEAAP